MPLVNGMTKNDLSDWLGNLWNGFGRFWEYFVEIATGFNYFICQIRSFEVGHQIFNSSILVLYIESTGKVSLHTWTETIEYH